MADLDSLLARSRDPGSFVERQKFTLSRDKAMEKMSKFTLRHPGQYSLEIVAAGVFAGGRWMFMDTDETAVTVGWVGGRAVTRSELDKLFDYLFVGEEVRENRHLRQIAIAVNVLLQQRPKLLRIESGDLSGSVRLDLNADGSGELGTPAHSIDGTYLFVDFGRSWFRSRRHIQKAIQLVETECLYSGAPIFLNGDGPFGWSPKRKMESLYNATQQTFRDDWRDGWVGLTVRKQPATFEVIVGGVRVSTREIPELGPGLCGVIRDDGLLKTADMSDVVADDRWLQMLHVVQPLATELIRSRDPSYRPMELAPLAEEAQPAPMEAPVAAASDGAVVRLGFAGELDQAALQILGEQGPVYAVAPADAGRPELDPADFPHPVLVVSPAERDRCGAHIEAFHPMDAEDIGFVAEQLGKRGGTERVSVDTEAGLLHLRLHLGSPVPHQGEEKGVPLFLKRGGRTARVLSLPFLAPHVSAVLEPHAPLDPLQLVVDLIPEFGAALWRLLPEAGTGSPEQQALARELMQHGHQYNGTTDGLVYRFPGWTDEATQRVLDAPIASSGLTGRTLISLSGTGTTAPIDGPDDFAALLPLAHRFGHGHITQSALRDVGLREVHHDGQRWQLAGEAPSPDCRGILRVGITFDPRPPEGWATRPTPHPIFLAAHHPDSGDLDWTAGWALLAATLVHPEMLSLSSDQAQIRSDLQRLASLAIDGPHRDGIRLKTGSGDSLSLEDLASGRVRLALRTGPELAEPDTLVVTADEAMLLQKLIPDLGWRFDDPPAVWTNEPGDPKSWLLVERIDTAEAHGWIGLRHPYDPTGSLLVRQGWTTSVLSEIDRHVRCHGWVNRLTDNDAAALEQLHLFVTRLLESLAAQLEAGAFSEEHRITAERYAADFAWMARTAPGWVFGDEIPGRLAADVEIPGSDASSWGSLKLWLDTHPSLRPALPFVIHGHAGLPADTSVTLNAPVLQDELLAARVHHAVARLALDTKTTVTITHRGSIQAAEGADSVVIQLGSRHPWVHAALSGDTRAMRFVLLEVGRKLHALERKMRIDHDFHAMQASLLKAE